MAEDGCDGVAQSDADAVAWYRKAANQGHAGAQCNLAFCLSAGRGVEKDPALAVEWMARAADQALPGAQE